MIFGCKLPEKPMPVHCHTKDNQLEIAEIHITPAESTQWFYASNPTYAFMEQRVKSRVLLVGSTNTITETQSKKIAMEKCGQTELPRSTHSTR